MIKPRVSVIIIFLNEESFLEQAVQSVFDQSFSDWELLLVDDGSIDGSSLLAQRLAEANSKRIQYLCHSRRKNLGMSASRNLGLSRAVGEFIGFLDADDVWLPHKLADQVAVLDDEQEADLVYGRTLFWHSWTVGAPSDFFLDLGVWPDCLHRPPKLFELLLEGESQMPTTCNALMRRSLFDRVGVFEDSFRGMYEDQVFFAKALLHAAAYVDHRVWAHYRQHEKSCRAISNDRGDEPRVRYQFLMWLKRYMRGRLDIDQRARVVLRKELFRCREPSPRVTYTHGWPA